MSQTSHFRINVTEDCDLEAVRQVIAEISTEKDEEFDVFVLYGPKDSPDIRTDEDARWREWKEEMLTVSRLLPHLTFTVTREGDTYERGTFCNGTSRVVAGSIQYPPFNGLGMSIPETGKEVPRGYFAAYVRDQEGVVIILAGKGLDFATRYFHTEYGKRNIVGEIATPTRELFAAYKLQGHDIETVV